MSMVRIVAEERLNGRKHAKHKIVIMCCINNDLRIVSGEWFGYVKDDLVTYPFLLRRESEFFYGWNEQLAQTTNIGEKTMQAESYFTLFPSGWSENEESRVYQITSVHEMHR